MAGYHISVNNRLYQVVDSNTDRIIATFLSENDAQVFLQGLYAKMFQEKKDMISNQLFLSSNANDFFNKVIFGQEKNSSNYDEEDSIEDLEEFDNFEDIEDIGSFSDLDSIDIVEDTFTNDSIDSESFQKKSTINNVEKIINEKISESNSFADNEEQNTRNADDKNIWIEKTSPTFEFNDNTVDLTIEKFGAPIDYLNVIEKNNYSTIKNFDDNSLGETSIYKKKEPSINNEEVKKTDLTEIINNNNIKETSEEEFIRLNKENTKTNTEDFDTVQNEYQTNKFKINAPENASKNVDKVLYEKKELENKPIELTMIYDDILQHGSGDTIEQTINNSIQSNPSIIEKVDEVIKKDKTLSDVIDLGPIQEEDDIFSTPRKDAMSDNDIEKAILAGEISFLTPKEQKKKNKLMKKEAKKNSKK